MYIEATLSGLRRVIRGSPRVQLNKIQNPYSRGPELVRGWQLDIHRFLGRQFIVLVDIGWSRGIIAMVGYRRHLVLRLQIQHCRSRYRERMLAVVAPVTLHTLHLHLHRGGPLVDFRICAFGAALQGLCLCRRLFRSQLLLVFWFTLPGYVDLLLLLRVLADDGAVDIFLAATATPVIKRCTIRLILQVVRFRLRKSIMSE